MMAPPRRGQRVTRSLVTSLFLASALGLAACSDSGKPVGPNLPGDPPLNPVYRRASFIADVDTRSGKVLITAPAQSVSSPASLSRSGGGDRPNFSIVAGDVIQLIASNYQASAVGAFVPGKVRVTFDINVLNKLPGIELITPTFPTPPAGASGVILFPYEVVTITTPGGVTVGGDGTDVIVEQPSRGVVDPSVDFDGDGTPGSGAPHNFFNDTGCPAGSNDCFRWKAYAQPLPPGATSETRSVGFDLDPTVGQFRARLILAADLRATGATPVGTIAGNVSSPQRGVLSGVTVSASGGYSGITNAAGDYSIGSVNVGPRTVTVSNLPAGCTAPASQSVTVSGGSTSTANFSVTCTVPSGTVSGTISSSLGGGISGASVVVTPTGGSAQPSVLSNSSGAYSAPNVPVGSAGTGSIALSNLPSGCTNPGSQPYSGLTSGGSVTVNITVSCTAPPAGYNYRVIWTKSAGQAIAELRIDMSTFDDSRIPGADDVSAFQADILYDATKLTFVSGSSVPASELDGATINGNTAGRVTVVVVANDGVGGTGDVGIARITFNIVSGATGSVTTTTQLTDVSSANLTDLIPRILKTEGTVTLP